MNKDDNIYLVHIIESISRIERHTGNLSKKDFLQNELIQAATIRELEIIGEAAKHISKVTRDKCIDIPWKKIAGMRDKLIHNYFGVDLEAVWKTIRKDIPVLKDKIITLL
ncbi:MAG: DUF86 domain-containing protein [Acidobacteriota bacterium]